MAVFLPFFHSPFSIIHYYYCIFAQTAHSPKIAATISHWVEASHTSADKKPQAERKTDSTENSDKIREIVCQSFFFIAILLSNSS